MRKFLSRTVAKRAATLAVALVGIALSSIDVASAATRLSRPASGNHCLVPFGDLNEIYGISYAIVVEPFCVEIGAGQQWVGASQHQRTVIFSNRGNLC